jgi:hypothetical protein
MQFILQKATAAHQNLPKHQQNHENPNSRQCSSLDSNRSPPEHRSEMLQHKSTSFSGITSCKNGCWTHLKWKTRGSAEKVAAFNSTWFQHAFRKAPSEATEAVHSRKARPPRPRLEIWAHFTDKMVCLYYLHASVLAAVWTLGSTFNSLHPPHTYIYVHKGRMIHLR